MVRKSSLVILAGWLAAAAQASISSQCINIRMQNGWLIGECLTGSGTTRIESSTYLQTRISNHEGVLEWATNGRFGWSCIDCSLSLSPVKLNCRCKPTWGDYVPTSLALDEHIAVYNGFLLSNLSGTPTPPAVASSIRFPADPSWAISYGNTSCITDNPGTCPTPNVGNGVTCASSSSVVNSDGVSDCFALRWPVSFPIWLTFGSILVSAPSGAFKFNVYDTVDCSGGIKGTVLPSEIGVCKPFYKQMIAFSAVPLWNGQT